MEDAGTDRPNATKVREWWEGEGSRTFADTNQFMIKLCLEASVAYALKIPILETVAPFLI